MNIRKIIREELGDWSWVKESGGERIVDLMIGDVVEIKKRTIWWYSMLNDCGLEDDFGQVEEGDRFKVVDKDESTPFGDISCCHTDECNKDVVSVQLMSISDFKSKSGKKIWVSDELLEVEIVEPSPSRGIVSESEDDGWEWARGVPYISYDYLKGKALEFDPPIMDEEYFNHIKETLKSLGFILAIIFLTLSS